MTFQQVEKSFQVADPISGTKRNFEWMPKDKAAPYLKLENAKTVPANDDIVKESIESTTEMLKSHNVDLNKFGTGSATSFTSFMEEISEGAARILLDAAKFKTLVRVVDIVLARVFVDTPQGKLYIVKMEENADGVIRKDIKQLPGTKKLPQENPRQLVNRLLSERLKLNDCQLQFVDTPKEVFEEEESSPSYPGFMTVYRKEIIEAKLIADAGAIGRIKAQNGGSFEPGESKGSKSVYQWKDDAATKTNAVKMSEPTTHKEVSALVHAPVGLDKDELELFFKKNNVDASAFGKNGSKSIEAFSKELIAGEAVLQKGKDGKVARIVDVLTLKVQKPNGDLLMEVSETTGDGSTKQLNRLPAVKRRSDENVFLAAHRVMTSVLHLDSNFVKLSEEVVCVEEITESTNYPGIKTAYNKRIVTGNFGVTEGKLQ
jgi:hypothetical protein